MNTSTHASRIPTERPSASAALWASAFVLMGLIVMQAGKSTGSAARADEAKARGLSVAAFTNNNDEEFLAAIDDQLGAFFIYRIGPGPEIELLENRPVSAMFPDQ